MTFSFDQALEYESEIGLPVEIAYEEGEQPYEEEDFAALGIDPLAPTAAKPGSEEKVLMLAARYAVGLPLWHNQDCIDHGPSALGLLEGGAEVDSEEENFEEKEVEGDAI